MLDTTTKKRIDDCRDILVGKLPDPKAQIEQITIGLIYKFMDDMDKEAIELGGTAKFFSGDYEKYSWSSLFDTKVTATEMLRLYSEAIESMEKNPNIPQLFRNIFNNAYLPYRDPETLKLFLKTIGEFEYTHSEMLGDAFEYLLSVMGSQGDAGQFRTPRHIIDFLVAAVNPGKNDTILDPACGTAGFLISAFKHIKEKNNNELTPDERKKLIQNFVGYDISPDMVRLSLVNLYLHGFSDPDIHEYDTLSSEERWNDSFDVILANPPFMSPKGGIRPHKKFSISSNRSEVLFVDYIAEHLNPKGRAGIIVPEGVIFQNGIAYKELRKMLVDNYLYAVVSLPAGIFNPYSGVKTSILLMDKELAKKSSEILFVKIENDGFNLGAQRNAVKGGQLEEAIKIIHDFAADRNLQIILASFAHIVPKSEIAEKGDYNLSGDRYKTSVKLYSETEFAPISELFDSIRNGRNVDQFDEKGKYRVTRIQTIADKSVDLTKTKWTNDEVPDDYIMEDGDILLSHINSFEHLAKSALFTGISEKVVHGTNLIRFKPNRKKVIPEYVAAIFKSQIFIDKARTFAQKAVNQASLRVGDLKSIEIPLPSLSVQQEIVTEIEVYKKLIDGAKTVVKNYKPKIDIDPQWEKEKLRNISDFKNGLNFSKDSRGERIKILGVSHFKKNLIAPISELDITQVNENINENFLLKKGDIVFVRSNGNQDLVGRSMVIPEIHERISFSGFTIRCRLKQGIDPLYIAYLFKSDLHSKLMKNTGRGANIRNLSQDILSDIIVPLPTLETQRQIVAQLQEEEELVRANKQLIKIFEQKIKDRIAKVWGTEKEEEESLSMAAEPKVQYEVL